jgi:hypothetical protein
VSFPASLNLVTVTGDFRSWPNGTPSTGKALFTCKQALNGPTDDVIIPPFEAEALFTAGVFSIALPPTNDPEWGPSGWAYEVTILINGRVAVRGSLVLPYDGGSVALADVLSSAPAVPGVSYVLLSSRGAPGGVASLDVSGYVPLTQLRNPNLVLGLSDPVPTGTPAGTVILRTTT